MNKRIEYIDAMRGFNIIILVMVHVSGFCLCIESNVPSIVSYFCEFMLPLFFFISGFVCYRKDTLWDFSFSSKFLRKKFTLLIIPTCIFFSIYIYVKNLGIQESLISDSKAGYWFTFVLFEYFILYFIIRSFTTIVQLQSIWEDIFAIGSGMALFVITVPSILEYIPIDNRIIGLLSFKHLCYFIYFVIGTIVKKYFDRFLRLLNGKLFITCCLVIFFGLNIFQDVATSHHFYLFRLLTAITAIFIILNYFVSHSIQFSRSTWLGKCLCYIGRRTLDIYFIHYFLLPLNLSYVLPIFTLHPMPILELATTFTVAISIISVCLLISSILRNSTILSLLLFGERKHYYNPNG